MNKMSRRSEGSASPVLCRRLGGCPAGDLFGTREHHFLCSQCWREVGGMEGRSPTVMAMVDEGYYQAPRLKTAGEMRITNAIATERERTQDTSEPLYANCRPWSQYNSVKSPQRARIPEVEKCVQPNCSKPSGKNVEKLCNECHKNYVDIFLPYRQFQTDG